MAQETPPYELTWTSTTTGGSSKGGGAQGYTLLDTIGQPQVEPMQGGDYGLYPGFLSGSLTVPNLVLLYVNADNDLAQYIPELVQHAHAGASHTDGVVLMVLDGPGDDDSYWYRMDGGNSAECGATLVANEPYTCNGHYVEGYNYKKFDENVGISETLASFVTTAIQTYPSAEKVILTLAGHGGGWSPNKLAGQPKQIGGQPGDPNGANELGGLLWDFHSAPGAETGHALSTTDLGSALNAVKVATGRTIDLLYLDACLMGMWEVAYEVKDSVSYLLASESWSWTSFQYDQHLHAVKQGVSIEEIGKAWARNEAVFLKNNFRTAYTYSLIKLGLMDELSNKVDRLADALTTIAPTNKAQLVEMFFAVDRFDSTQDENYVIDGLDNYADLGHLAEVIVNKFPTHMDLVTAAQAISTTLASAIITNEAESGILPAPYPANRWAWQKPTGLSIYLPLNPDADDWKRAHYHQVRSSKEHRWDDFITAFWGINTEAPAAPVCPDPCGLPPAPLFVEATATVKLYLPLIMR